MSIYGRNIEKTAQEYQSKFYADTQDDQRLLMSDGEMNGNLDLYNNNNNNYRCKKFRKRRRSSN